MKNLLPLAARKLRAEKGILQFRMREVWREVVGELLARQSQPVALKAGTLMVKTTGPAWTQELLLRQHEILDRFNRELPRARARELRCSVGRFEPGEPTLAPPPPAVDWERIPLDPGAQEKVERLAGQIRDPGLSQGLRRLLTQLERRRTLARRNGHRPCALCSRMQEAVVCRSCLREREQERWRRILQALGRSPWLTRDCLRDQFQDLTTPEYFRARQQLWSIWEKTLMNGLGELPEGARLPDSLRTVAVDLCMLATSMTADELEERHVRYALRPWLAKAYLENRAPARREKSSGKDPKPPNGPSGKNSNG